VSRSLAAIAPSRPVASPAGNEENELLKPEQDRAKKGEDGYLGSLDRHVHAATVGRHDDGDRAAIRQVPGCHGSRSLRGETLNAQPDHRHKGFNDGPIPFVACGGDTAAC
jgi:hypothetical protein